MTMGNKDILNTLFQFLLSPLSSPPKEYIFWINTKCIYRNLQFLLPISLKINMPDSSSSPSLKQYSVSRQEHFSWLKKCFFWFTFLKTVPSLCKSCILGSSHCTGVCWIWEWPGRNQPQIFQVSLPCPQCSFSEHRAKNLNRLIQGAMLFSIIASVPWAIKLSLPTQVTWQNSCAGDNKSFFLTLHRQTD